MDSIPLKHCTKCKQEFPATPEFFHPRVDRKAGLTSQCKKCRNAARKALPYVYHKEKERKRYQSRKSVLLKQRSVYYRAHVEEYQQYHQQYRKAHREQGRVYGHNRRARERSVQGTHTPEQIREQYARQNGKCYYCRHKVKWGEHHVDHIIPLTREGSSNNPWNLVIACCSCNTSKKDKLPHEWPEGGRLF